AMPALVDAVLGQRLRGAAAALVERGEEAATRADLLWLRGVHGPIVPARGGARAVRLCEWLQRAQGRPGTGPGGPGQRRAAGPARSSITRSGARTRVHTQPAPAARPAAHHCGRAGGCLVVPAVAARAYCFARSVMRR